MIAELRRKDEDPEYALNTAGIILAGLARYPNKPVTTDPTLDAAMNAAMNPTAGNHICDAEIQLGTVIYNDFHGSAVIERLQCYEQRIESSLFKTIRQIQQIQERRIKQDAAQEKRDWAQIRAEGEERKRRRDAEYANRLNPDAERSQAPGHTDGETINVLQEYEQRKTQNEPNPDTDCHSRENCHSRESGNPLNAQNKANSDLTSISDITYNRYRQERDKRDNPNQHPSRPKDQ